ncbi:histone-lysine N-methyltransferase SETMAR [Trichonephila clavipes]|nr:histone-lysine N-methyltransferase SETMAR [Trichonephila clavipes]
MAKFLRNWSRLTVRAVIRFLCAKNVSASAMSRQHVAKLCPSFQSGIQNVENQNRSGSGRPSSSTTEITTARIGKIIQNVRRVTLREISSDLGLAMVVCSISFMMCCHILRQWCEIIHRDLAQWTGT